MTEKVICEVCIDSVESGIASWKGGGSRVEICSNLMEGGTTASIATLITLKQEIPIPVFVMIRPRGGDFCYSDVEFNLMKLEIEICKTYNVADGFVFGILLPNGNVDIQRTKLLVETAHPMPVTFHRAIDMTPDIYTALDDIISIPGITRVLTSGGENNCLEGLDTLVKLVQRANNRITIVPGGGITHKNIPKIISATGVKEFHVSARVTRDSAMTYRNTSCISLFTFHLVYHVGFMGGTLRPPEYSISLTDGVKVSTYLMLANSSSPL